jgi:hypothetical protein
MDSLRNISQLGRGNGQLGRESPDLIRCTSTPEDGQSWELVNDGNEQPVPNVVGRFGHQGGECNLSSRELIHASH